MARVRQVTAMHVLLVVAFLELAINRIAVPMLRPTEGDPPSWHVGLDYVGLFLFYFVGALAVFVVIARAVQAVEARRGIRDLVANVVSGVVALGAAIPLVISVPEIGLPLEIAFAVAIIAIVATVYDKDADLGAQIGLPLLAIPFLIHLYYTLEVIDIELVWPETSLDGPGQNITRAGVMVLCLAGLVTPYCFAPRPFARAVTRPIPVIVAMATATTGAILARLAYGTIAKASSFAIGVHLHQGQSDPRMALYLLAIATLAWTLTSCALAAAPTRRTIGLGLGLLLLGGYGFKWPHHYLLPLIGLALIAESARRVREEELAGIPISLEMPIADSMWSAFVGTMAQGLRRTLGEVHSLTTRGEGGLASTVLVGEVKGMPVRTRIERLDGTVIVLDVVLGRDIDELRGATLSLWAQPIRGNGANPAAPEAAPPFHSGDTHFDDRFKLRGSAVAFSKLFDDGIRARAVTALDGWLAYWEHDGLRYRIYPGRGAPLDHPLPLSDLALVRVPANAERLVAVVELLVEIAQRGVVVTPTSTPEASEPEGTAVESAS